MNAVLPTTVEPLEIMLVDDDPAMLRLLAKVIAGEFGEHARVVSACEPQDAFRLFAEQPCDVVITDLEMPGLNGLELIQLIKRRNPATQVILISAHSTLDAVFEALARGAGDFLLKPFQPHELVTLLHEAEARSHRWRRAIAGSLGTGVSSLSVVQLPIKA